MMTIDGQTFRCSGNACVRLTVPDSEMDAVDLQVMVVKQKPLGLDVILGMDAIGKFGGVFVRSPGQLAFGTVSASRKLLPERGGNTVASVGGAAIRVSRPDFDITYDSSSRNWTASWKWTDGAPHLYGSVEEYPMPGNVRQDYEEELSRWISAGWLLKYDERTMGPVRATIPLMAVVQANKEKVRPVMDFREVNKHVTAFTADADICSAKMREWRRLGKKIALIDMEKAYLQVLVNPELWPYQTVIVRGVRYCLTRLGFGLNVSPLIMKSVLTAALEQNSRIAKAASAYVDDIIVDETIASADEVKEHLRNFGLQCKPIERIGDSSDGVRVLGVRVFNNRGCVCWKRDNDVGKMPAKITKRSIFSLCGRIVSHLPVCGSLRVAASFLKRRANAVSSSWDDEIHDEKVICLARDLLERTKRNDPSLGRWEVSGTAANVWVDASSIALGVLLEVDGCVVEDACWLRRDDATHINMAELDAAQKGVNLALLWGMKTIRLMTDSKIVYGWLKDVLTGKSRVKTKAACEMLIRRRLESIRATVEECEILVDVCFVNSAENRADALTRVPQKWLDTNPLVCSVASTVSDADIRQIHERCGHPGVRKSAYFCRKVWPNISRKHIARVIRQCEACQSFDPAPVRWNIGNLEVSEIWQRVSMDVTHVNSAQFLTLVDCGPSRFAIWRRLQRHDSHQIVQILNQVFCERGAPHEILTDNATSFRSSVFQNFAQQWNVKMTFRCAYYPQGNGISERMHRTVKRIVARSDCSVEKAVYWYNVSPHDGFSSNSTPASQVYRYEPRACGLDCIGKGEGKAFSCPFLVGDRVWVRDPSRRCDVKSKLGFVTGVNSPQNVEVDGVPRHVRDLRPATSRIYDQAVVPERESDGEVEDLIVREMVDGAPANNEEPDASLEPSDQREDEVAIPRRSERLRHRRACQRGVTFECDLYDHGGM